MFVLECVHKWYNKSPCYTSSAGAASAVRQHSNIFLNVLMQELRIFWNFFLKKSKKRIGYNINAGLHRFAKFRLS
uniref:Uncharacterized protein n=1 Tax=Romanomermis culicivorax TaxID=13658 RepID=A0A915JP56_ROMCU